VKKPKIYSISGMGERTMRAQLDEDSLINANAQFWEQMLAMRLEPVPMAEQFCVGTRHLLGSVELSGMWTGRIEVRIDERLALSATAAMLMQPMDTVGETDTLDAAKEIANMIAGVLKSSLPRPCAMTVPVSAVEAEGFCGLQRTENTLAVGFRHADGDLMVRVWEHD
jgi:CheY-specific phosphatase CheX